MSFYYDRECKPLLTTLIKISILVFIPCLAFGQALSFTSIASFIFFTPDNAFYPVTIFLLETSFLEWLSAFVKPELLYIASFVFLLLTLALIAGTYRILYLKNKKRILETNIRQRLEVWITETMMSESTDNFYVPEEFGSILKRGETRQMLIDELVRNKSNFRGIVSANIIKLYHQLSLNVDSSKKLDSTESHILCQGIHELCVMEQMDHWKKLYRLTNSQHKDIRIEAQTAILQWYGFKGLRFLDLVIYPITEFQQLKLIELLNQLHFTELPKLKNWLASSNDTVVKFALKLAEHYKQSHVSKEAEKCLGHQNEEVRIQAVNTLVAIANASTASLLTVTYTAERFKNRLNILTQLLKIADNEQRDFLIFQLHEGHQYLKLAAAKVLVQCTTGGMEMLEAKSYAEPLVYKAIYNHVKSQVVR